MSARLKGRVRAAARAAEEVAAWARTQPDVRGVALVGSHARGRARLGSDVDLVVLTDAPEARAADTTWFTGRVPRSRLIRAQAWGPLLERRFRLASGLHVEVGLVAPSWAAVPLDDGTRRVLAGGCRVLEDPDGLLVAVVEAAAARPAAGGQPEAG